MSPHLKAPVNLKAPRYGHVLFHTSAAAFRAEKLALGAHIQGARLVPTPRELSSDCGVALRFEIDAADPPDSVPAMDTLLASAHIPYDRIEPGH